MRWIFIISIILPTWIFSQAVQTIEICLAENSYVQEYWVANGPNQYYWTVEGGIIQEDNGSSIIVNWLNVPYGMYQITVYVISNEGCDGDTTSLLVDVDECSFNGIYIPNSFTTNNDGRNDVFGPIGENIIHLEIYIYNRWGEQIYESRNGVSWDGRSNGKMCQQDVYVWMVVYRFIGEEITKHTSIGHVVLVR